MTNKPDNPDRADKATRFSASRQPSNRAQPRTAPTIAPTAQGNNNLSPLNRNIIDQCKQQIRDNTMLYLETVHNIALGNPIGADKEKGIDGERPDIRLQLEAATYLIDRVLGKAVQPLAVEKTGEMSLEQAVDVLKQHNLPHLMPKPREVIDEQKP